MSQEKNKAKHTAESMRRSSGQIPRMEVDVSELEAILQRAGTGPLSQEEQGKLRAALETLLFLTQELEKKSVSVKRLKELLFGAKTEKTRKVLEKLLGASSAQEEAGTEGEYGDVSSDGDKEEDKEKVPGHGRNGVEAYTGAERRDVIHESLKERDPCPECGKGKVYAWTPGWIVTVRGQAPVGATVYRQEKLRCNLCGKVFAAKLPEGVEERKYDAESAAMIALLKYGTGLPFNRLQRLQGSLGIPLPASTQWEIVETASRSDWPVFEELVWQAAQGEVVHNDDTTMKILDIPEQQSEDGRKGVFTSGIVATGDGHKIAVFFTGRKHAGENLGELLKQRAAELAVPIQMCDALSRNIPEELKAILGNCLSHGRRRFVDVAGSFPEEVGYVLKLLEKVYGADAVARAEKMSGEERLGFHQAESGPVMEELHRWMAAQITERKVEPNSGLGEAIIYMQKHWQELTLFLREPGAPLDNNICERALKKAILHRKNAYFYKTANGARVGDLYMSLIHTCELNDQNPFQYLTALQKHSKDVAAHAELWMPWNYQDTLARLAFAART